MTMQDYDYPSTYTLLVQLGVVHPEAGVDHLVVLEEALLHKGAGDGDGALGTALGAARPWWRPPPWHAHQVRRQRRDRRCRRGDA